MKKKHQVLPFLDSPRFPLGKVRATKDALSKVSHSSLILALKRHERADWGELRLKDWETNDDALGRRSRLKSVYQDEKKVRFWVITEPDRSTTTINLPGEYGPS